MALIKCPDCFADCSDLAVSCPKCGYPLVRLQKEAEIEKVRSQKAEEERKRRYEEQKAEKKRRIAEKIVSEISKDGFSRMHRTPVSIYDEPPLRYDADQDVLTLVEMSLGRPVFKGVIVERREAPHNCSRCCSSCDCTDECEIDFKVTVLK